MKISLDHSSHIPLYIQIENQLKKEIQKPEYKDGKKLPNEEILAQQLGISRSTLRQAINKLVYEGLLIRKRGIGTIVSNASFTSNAHNWLSFSQEMKALGIKVKNYELYVRWVYPTIEICNFFNIDKKTKVLKLERLRGDVERPFVYFISYFSPKTNLTGDEDFSAPLYDILEKNNIFVKLSKEEVSAMLADKELAEKLQIKTGDAILKRKRHVYDPAGRPIEWNVGFYCADSFVYTIESERKV
ncbi:MAG TPA: GntR family transcriptional regulator [Dysgonomonas sp.]|nr:GntR family transcriptional regulator [Dysgonomonas sp.]